MALERHVYNKMLRYWPPDILIERIETSTMEGMADISCCFRGTEFWIETKVLYRDGSVSMRPKQPAWHLRRMMAGSRTFIIAANETRAALWKPQVKGLDLQWTVIMEWPAYDDRAWVMALSECVK